MTTAIALASADTVANQPPPCQDTNLFADDVALREAVEREGGGWIAERAYAYGTLLGQAETLRLGDLANHHAPTLHTHDRWGNRIDEVEYHPAYHELMRLGVEAELHALPWTSDRPGAHVARAALAFLHHQADEGTSCPLTMTFAVVPSLRLQPDVAAEWEPRALSSAYDPRPLPADQKRGALFGMAMTERQGGSDVRANTTRAVPIGAGGPGGEYTLHGHKWFCSAPMNDAFLVLAQAPGGLSCFLLPRWLPDGQRNVVHIDRLKDKLGNRSNASAEIRLEGAWARMVGQEGRGVATIIEMVRHTRLDCAWGSAATLRRAVAEAIHHCAHRAAFGRLLIDQPLMKNVLADLCLESEAATALAFRLARGFDQAAHDPAARAFTRLATAIGKFWITKRAPAVTLEAMECLGGSGYVEECVLPRLYRDAPVNSIWEGSGNIQCLDVLRALRHDPDALDVYLAEVRPAQGTDARLDRYLARLASDVRATDEAGARRLTERLALALQASLLVRHAPPAVADGFLAGRLADDGGLAFGCLPSGVDCDAIIARSRPHAA